MEIPKLRSVCLPTRGNQRLPLASLAHVEGWGQGKALGMSLQGPGVEGAAMSHHAQEEEFGPLCGSHREGDGWAAWGEGRAPYPWRR